MGAGQSSNADGSSGARTGEVKRCYYELLGIDRQASNEEIKKAYRKRALELHPDRNYGNVEETTKLFAELQSAYAVLSDPHERAWYDSHRAAILRDETGPSEEKFEHNIRVTTAADILRMFSKFDTRMDFSDSPSGFYSVFRGTFDTLAKEEELACEWDGLDAVVYPSFGHAGDDYEITVKPFYAAWSGFATSKSFSWKDMYRLSDAPDRRVRRMMEKENKRFREEGIHEFNDSVRSLIAFLRKRDPRYKLNSQSEADRQNFLREAAAAQASRSRAANQAKTGSYMTPGWMKSKERNESDTSDHEHDLPVEHLECIICRKTFKSENQYEAHEKSKKHIKAVQQIRRELQIEDKNLNIHNQVDQNNRMENPYELENLSDMNQLDLDSGGSDSGERASFGFGFDAPISSETVAEGTVSKILPLSLESNEPAPSEIIKGGTNSEANSASHKQESSSPIEHISRSPSPETLGQEPGPKTKLKIGKAKVKRARKAAQGSAGIRTPTEFTCGVCQAAFASKNKLFDHIKTLNHTRLKSSGIKGNKCEV